MTFPHPRHRRRVATLLAVIALALSATPAVADDAAPAPSASATASAGSGAASPEPTPPPADAPGPEPDEAPTPEPTADAPAPAPGAVGAADPLDGPDLTGAGTWQQDSRGWWYRLADGTYPASTWATINGSVYRFDRSGYMSTGWVQDDGSWFYLLPTGQRAHGWTADRGRWFYLDEAHGRMATGWQQVGGSWYYLHSTGAMATGWLQLDGSWYYLGSTGQRAHGWTSVKGSWFYLDPANGRMATGWLRLGETWYYLRPSGAMATGWFTQVGVWYYLRSSGAMATGWVKDGSSWYYMEASGVMVTGQRVINGKSEQFAANGVWYGYHAPAGYLQPTDHITSLGYATNDLTWGMNGIKVRIVQQRLGIWSSGTLASVDATFQRAVRNFQARAGLPQTGVVDRATWDALGTGYSWWVDQYQATPVSLSATRSERIEAMIGYAWTQIGSSYTWGGAGSYSFGFDCSGLVLQSLYAAGMDPQPIDVIRHAWPSYRTSQELYAYSGFQHVPFNQRQRGDLIFYTTNGVVTHVSIYLGDDMVVHTDWMGRPARMDHITAGYSWYRIAPTVVRPFP